MPNKLMLLTLCLFSLVATANAQQDLGSTSGYLGVTLRDIKAEDVKTLKLPREAGVLIESVSEDSPAARAGLLEKDVILEFAGTSVWSSRQFQRLVADTPPEREVEISLLRNGERLRKTVKVGEREDRVLEGFGPMGRNFRFQIPRNLPDDRNFNFDVQPFGRGRDAFVIGRRGRLGIQGTALTAQMAEHLGVTEKAGVLVMEVNSDSPAAKAGLKAGDVIVSVNGKKVDSPAELTAEIRGRSADLEVVRDKKRQTIKVSFGNSSEDSDEEPGRL